MKATYAGMALVGALLGCSSAESVDGQPTKKQKRSATVSNTNSGSNEDAGPKPETDPFSPDESTENCESWLDCTNYYRAMSGITPISEDSSFQTGVSEHAAYMVKNGGLTHHQKVGAPGYTRVGADAGLKSVCTGSPIRPMTPQAAIESWMQAPFHALGIMYPRLMRGAYGTYTREAGTESKLAFAAALNKIDGILSSKVDEYPFKWPGDRTTVPLYYFYGERPDPLTSCPGYEVPTGLPVFVMLGDGSSDVGEVSHSMTLDGAPVEHCEIDEANYTNPSADDQRTGRGSLRRSNTVVLIAKNPLSRGGTYAVSVTGNGRSVDWSFRVSPNARDYPDVSLEALRKATP